jgi:hypothetical protein
VPAPCGMPRIVQDCPALASVMATAKEDGSLRIGIKSAAAIKNRPT